MSITGLGAVAASGSAIVAPTATTTYTLTASNATGSTTRNVTVTVGTGTTSTTTLLRLYLEAEKATLTSPMSVVTDTTASGGAYIRSSQAESGSAVFSFSAPSSGTYVVWGRINSPDTTTDSFYVSVDGGPEDIYDTAENGWSSSWQWTVVNGRGSSGTPLALNPRTFSLSAGTHTIRFRAREANTKLDRIFITNDLTANLAYFTQYIEGESATLGSPMQAVADSTASGGAYIVTESFEVGTARFTINAPTSGQYYVWARVIALDGSQDSFYVSIDGTDEDVYDAAQNKWSSSWQWDPVIGRSTGASIRVFNLSAGSHVLQFRGREPNLRLDRIFITNNLSAKP